MTTVDEILTSGAETYKRKNSDYGQSWKSIGHAIWALANERPIVLDSPEKVIAFGLFTRRFDKIARSMNGEFFTDNLNFESAVDSDEDESVYAAMQAENKYDQQRNSEKNAAPTAVADGGLSEASFEELTAILTERRRETEQLMKGVGHDHPDWDPHEKQWLG